MYIGMYQVEATPPTARTAEGGPPARHGSNYKSYDMKIRPQPLVPSFSSTTEFSSQMPSETVNSLNIEALLLCIKKKLVGSLFFKSNSNTQVSAQRMFGYLQSILVL